MAISKILRDQLKTVCKEEKYEDKSLYDFLLKIYDSHETKEKIQLNNTDLIKQRKQYKDSLSALKIDNETLKAEYEKFKAGNKTLTEEEKKLLEKGMNKEVEGLINAMNDKLSKNDTALNLLTDQLKESSLQTKKAELNAKKENLNTSLIKALSKVNIKDSNKVNTALALINSGKMADIKDDNSIIYGYQEDNKPFTFSNEHELAKYISEQHKYLVSSSGNKGGGSNYTQNSNLGSVTIIDNKGKTRDQMIQQTDENFNKFFT